MFVFFWNQTRVWVERHAAARAKKHLLHGLCMTFHVRDLEANPGAFAAIRADGEVHIVQDLTGPIMVQGLVFGDWV